MKLLLAFFLISHSAFAIDIGDGSDGTCDVSGAGNTQITFARKYYQCDSLVIDANLNDFSGAGAGAGGSELVIKVRGIVTVAFNQTINLAGSNGVVGNAVAGVKAGGNPGAGGGAGGNALGVGLDGANGSGAGAGVRGLYVTPFATDSYGGGGGGGSYRTQNGTPGIDGDDVGGTGTIPGSGGVNGAIFGSEASFDSSFTGGSGGAGGGGASQGGTPLSGGSGGGGGGAIRIIAGGNITVAGSIVAPGGNGGGTNVTPNSGAGGGGSGGAIWLQSAGDITVTATGTITALGGSGGENDNGSGFGGYGGIGRIRLDDSNGVINAIGGSTIGPSFSTTFSPSAITTSGTSEISRSYSSEVSCASIALDDQNKPFNNILNLVIGFGFACFIQLILSKKSKV